LCFKVDPGAGTDLGDEVGTMALELRLDLGTCAAGAIGGLCAPEKPVIGQLYRTERVLVVPPPFKLADRMVFRRHA